jgi:glutathione S-transferase
MLIVHHLGISQSERIVWLLEELGLPYKLVKHVRDPVMSPESLKSLPGNKTGKSPFIEDTDARLTLSESGAISDYIIGRYGNGRLALKPDDPHFSDYCYWYHFANASQQMAMQVSMFLDFAGLPDGNVAKQVGIQRLHAALQQTDDRLKDNKWLAGPEFTAADVMSVYGVSTQRYFGPQVSLAEYPNILRWLKDCSERPGYKRAMQAGDPDMEPLIGAKPPSKSLLQGGVKNDFWKKDSKASM